MTEVEKLYQRLYGEGGLGVTKFHIFPGTDPKATAEDRAREVNKSLDRILAGDYEEANIDGDNE